MAEHDRNISQPLILFAEDDEDDQEFILLAMQRIQAQHQVHIAANGFEALEFLNRLDDYQLPCVIVLDLNMPLCDGLQTLQTLNANSKYAHIPKVIFSTSNAESDRRRCLSNGAAEYLVKPENMLHAAKTFENILKYCQ